MPTTSTRKRAKTIAHLRDVEDALKAAEQASIRYDEGSPIAPGTPLQQRINTALKFTHGSAFDRACMRGRIDHLETVEFDLRGNLARLQLKLEDLARHSEAQDDYIDRLLQRIDEMRLHARRSSVLHQIEEVQSRALRHHAEQSALMPPDYHDRYRAVIKELEGDRPTLPTPDDTPGKPAESHDYPLRATQHRLRIEGDFADLNQEQVDELNRILDGMGLGLDAEPKAPAGVAVLTPKAVPLKVYLDLVDILKDRGLKIPSESDYEQADQ